MECGPRRPRPGTLHKCRGPESLQPGSPESVSASERTAVTPPASWPRLQQLCGEAGWGGAPLCGAHSSLGSCRPFPATHVGPSSQGDGAGRASGQPAGAPPLP